MTKERLKRLFTDAASDVADQFYPKGESDRRGEFIRDAGLLWVKISDNVDAYVKSKRKKPIALHVLMIVEDVIQHFDEVVQGWASDEAYYELVDFTEQMLLGTMSKRDYVRHLEFTFGFDGSAEVATVRQMSDKRFKYYRENGVTENVHEFEAPPQVLEQIKKLEDEK